MSPAPSKPKSKDTPRKGRTNAAWHKAHRMPKNATTAERLAWHIEHAKHCACRPMPAKLRALADEA